MTTTNTRAAHYIMALMGKIQFPSGIAYENNLRQANLDFSEESLRRIDSLLDAIRKNEKPNSYEFINDIPRQNFLYALAFYVGKVIEINSASKCDWLQGEEYNQIEPQHQISTDDIRNSFIAVFSGGIKGDGYFSPLATIFHRLFDSAPEQKSVWFSAGMYIPRHSIS